MWFLEKQACPQRSLEPHRGQSKGWKFSFQLLWALCPCVQPLSCGFLVIRKLDHHISTRVIKCVTPGWKLPCHATPPSARPAPQALLFNLYLYSLSLFPVPLHKAVDNGNKCGCTRGWGCDRLRKQWADLLLWGWRLRLSWNKNIIFRIMIYGFDSCLIVDHKY